MKKFERYLENKLKNPTIKEIYEKSNQASIISLQIYTYRKKLGLTQKQLAEKIGVKQSNIARIENADYKYYTLSTLRKVASALDCDLSVTLAPQEQIKSLLGFNMLEEIKTGAQVSISYGFHGTLDISREEDWKKFPTDSNIDTSIKSTQRQSIPKTFNVNFLTI